MLKNVRSPGPDRRSRTAGSCRSANGNPSSDRKRVSVSWDAMTSLIIENFSIYRESRTCESSAIGLARTDGHRDCNPIENSLCPTYGLIGLLHPAVNIREIELLALEWRERLPVREELGATDCAGIFSHNRGLGRSARRSPATAPRFRAARRRGFLAQRCEVFQPVKPALRAMRHLDRDAALDESLEQCRGVLDRDAEAVGERGSGDNG